MRPYEGDFVSARSETEEEEAERLHWLAEKEREEAYAKVSKAISTYRWWGWTNIVIALRMTMTRIRLALGMKLWP